MLQNNAGDDLPIAANSTSFVFATAVASGSGYQVAVLTQPHAPSQLCAVTGGSGNVAGGNVTTVSITCTTSSFSVGGSIAGLTGSGLVLRDNGGDNLTVPANATSFTFPTKVASGAPFAVTLLTPPSSPSQACTVAGGSGNVGAADVSSVTINCMTNSFTVGGNVTGLSGTVVLEDNGGDDATVSSNGSFAFGTPIASGQPYAVTVLTQPLGPISQTCTVTSGAGTIAGAPITAQIDCVTNNYKLQASVNGLTQPGLTLANGTDSVSVITSGTVTVSAAVPSGASYTVSIAAQPATQTCAIVSPGGTVAATDATVTVNCTDNLYKVAGTLSGVVGTVSLHNGADDITVTNGTFAFPTQLLSGTAYAVSVTTPLSDCTITNGNGTIAGADTAITIACNPPLVYYFPFDGDATDQSGNGHDGTVNGATLVDDRNGTANSAYAFDGSSWIEAAGDSLPIGNSSRTLTMWLKPNPSVPLWGIVYWGQNDCTGNMWGLGYEGSATFWGGCNDFESGLTIPADGTWTFVAVSFAAPNHIHIRVNGAYADQDLGAPATPASKLWIGGETTTNDSGNFRNHYDGAIDSLRIYNRALTDAEIDTIENTLP